MSLTDRIPVMRSGAILRNLLVMGAYILLLPFILIAGFFYLPYAVGTNRHNLGDRLANSPLRAIPTIQNGGWQSAITVLIGLVVIVAILNVAIPAAETDPAGDAGPAPDATPTVTPADDQDESADTSGEDETAPSSSEQTPSSSEQTQGSESTGDSDSGEDTSGTAGSDRLRFTVTVVDVVDGDTMDVRFENGTEERVRLLGVDTPEVHTEVSPDEFEGVPDTQDGRQCLNDWGQQASEYATQELSGETVQIQFDAAADRRGTYDRLLTYIIVDGENFNYQLIETGHTRVFDSTFSESDRFYEAESAAQTSETGVWECRSLQAETPPPDGTSDGGELVVATIHEDADGNDHENLNDEYIIFRNDGDSQLDLTGWTVADDADHTYQVPTGFTLGPGEEVTLYTGSGSDTATELYWGSGRAIWNNGGDTIFIYDDSGSLVLEQSY